MATSSCTQVTKDDSRKILLVDNLHSDVTESDVRHKFRDVGPISSICICRTRNAQEEFIHAHVEFESSKDAQNALTELEFCLLRGRPLVLSLPSCDHIFDKCKYPAGVNEQSHSANSNQPLDHSLLRQNTLRTQMVEKNTDDLSVNNDQQSETSDFDRASNQNPKQDQSRLVLNSANQDIASCAAASVEMSSRRATLYVGDLHPDVTEAMLFDKFQSAGPILSIRVCRNMVTRRSLGYAYINFQLPADAERALDTMNFDTLRGRPLRIIWSHLDSALRESGIGNIVIKNLDKNIDTSALYKIFSAFGNILSCKIMTDENGQSRGFGYIQFDNQKAADEAINKVNGMLLADKEVFVGPFISRDQCDNAGDSRKFTHVFIKNFGDQLDDEKLRELFSVHGTVTSCEVAKDENGQSKGFGFCSFESFDDAEEAVQALNKTIVGDKELYVARFQSKSERQADLKRRIEQKRQERMTKYQGVNLFVKNLDDTIDDERLKMEFSKFGNITSAKVMMANGRTKGFGFVCFSSADEATKAVTEMNEAIIGSKSLYVALAQRKEDRRMYLANQFLQRNVQRAPPQMQLPYPGGMPAMMPYMATAMGPSQLRSYFPQGAIQSYRPTLRWTTQAPQAGIGHQAMASMQFQASNIGVAQQRGVSMTGVQARTAMPTNIRPALNGPAQMMGNPPLRPQPGAPPAATYTQTALNLPTGLRLTFDQCDRSLNDVFHLQNQPSHPTSNDVLDQKPLTLTALTEASSQLQKQMIGERLFPLIAKMQPELAGKITGMLLEFDNMKLLQMLESPELLKANVEEAIAVLQAHQAKQLYAASKAAHTTDAS